MKRALTMAAIAALIACGDTGPSRPQLRGVWVGGAGNLLFNITLLSEGDYGTVTGFGSVQDGVRQLTVLVDITGLRDANQVRFDMSPATSVYGYYSFKGALATSATGAELLTGQVEGTGLVRDTIVLQR